MKKSINCKLWKKWIMLLICLVCAGLLLSSCGAQNGMNNNGSNSETNDYVVPVNLLGKYCNIAKWSSYFEIKDDGFLYYYPYSNTPEDYWKYKICDTAGEESTWNIKLVEYNNSDLSRTIEIKQESSIKLDQSLTVHKYFYILTDLDPKLESNTWECSS